MKSYADSDLTDAANAIAAEGHPVDLDDLATISPYITRTIRRFGNWTLNLTPPDEAPPPAWTWSRVCCSVHRPPDARSGNSREQTFPRDRV